jgi:hypothetical protein
MNSIQPTILQFNKEKQPNNNNSNINIVRSDNDTELKESDTTLCGLKKIHSYFFYFVPYIEKLDNVTIGLLLLYVSVLYT